MSANPMPRTAQAMTAARAALNNVEAAAWADFAEALAAATAKVTAAAAAADEATPADEVSKILTADAALKAATTADEARAAAAMLPQPAPAKTTTATNDDVTKLRNDVNALTKRVDGHDQRHHNAEDNIKALNGAVGITQNKDGAWVPVPDGQFDRNGKVQQHLGYSRDKDGKVSFTSPTVKVAGRDVRLMPAFVAFVAMFLLVFIPTAINRGFWAGFTWWSLVIAAAVSIAVLLFTNRTPKTASAA